MASDQIYIPIMKPTALSAEKPDDVPNLFDGDMDTSYELFLRPPSFLTLVLDLGGTIPFNTLELSELLCFQLELESIFSLEQDDPIYNDGAKKDFKLSVMGDGGQITEVDSIKTM